MEWAGAVVALNEIAGQCQLGPSGIGKGGAFLMTRTDQGDRLCPVANRLNLQRTLASTKVVVVVNTMKMLAVLTLLFTYALVASLQQSAEL